MMLEREHEFEAEGGGGCYNFFVICFSWNRVAVIVSRGITWGKGDRK